MKPPMAMLPLAGSLPDEPEDREEMILAIKAFMIGIRAQELAQQSRRTNEPQEYKK